MKISHHTCSVLSEVSSNCGRSRNILPADTGALLYVCIYILALDFITTEYYLTSYLHISVHADIIYCLVYWHILKCGAILSLNAYTQNIMYGISYHLLIKLQIYLPPIDNYLHDKHTQIFKKNIQ
jgi:hypothetical protein